jgi:hypothetical protein
VTSALFANSYKPRFPKHAKVTRHSGLADPGEGATEFAGRAFSAREQVQDLPSRRIGQGIEGVHRVP